MRVLTKIEKEKEIISARDAAMRLGRGVATVEQALRDGTFPVGTAYRTKSGRWVYIIPRLAFERFLSGEIAGRRGRVAL